MPALEKKNFYKRCKRIFYDTDMIAELQEESVRICASCQGYMTISSQAQRGRGILNTAFCVSLPRNACSSCRDDARKEFDDRVGDRRFSCVYLQDKGRDAFRACKNMTRAGRITN
jgi:hypothetical protein